MKTAQPERLLPVAEPVAHRQGPGRLTIEVVATSGRAASVELRVRLDIVEVWHDEHCAAVFGRDRLTGWLHGPAGPYNVDEVTWSIDKMIDRDGRLAITLPGVSTWALSPLESARLLRLLHQ